MKKTFSYKKGTPLLFRLCLGMIILGGGVFPFLSYGSAQSYGRQEKNASSFDANNSLLWVRQAESYFNDIQYLKASFTQNNPDGSLSKGVFYLSRPTKMRLEYTSPHPLILLSDGQFLTHYDPELDEVSRTPLALSPAVILLTHPVRFTGALQVLETQETAEDVLITVVKVGEEDLGRLTFHFQKSPFDLKGWTVLDQQGQIIHIHLDTHKERPATLDYSLFHLHRRP